MKAVWVIALIAACFYWGLWAVAATVAALWVVLSLIACIIDGS